MPVSVCALHDQGHSAKMSFYSGILYAKFFDCGVSQMTNLIVLCHSSDQLISKRKCQLRLWSRSITTCLAFGLCYQNYGRWGYVWPYIVSIVPCMIFYSWLYYSWLYVWVPTGHCRETYKIRSFRHSRQPAQPDCLSSRLQFSIFIATL